MRKPKKKLSIMLDSGAFSAFSMGVKIDLQEYIEFIKKHQKVLDVYINLDDIKDPAKSWENQREMEKQGLHPMPVYHVGEDSKYLDMCLADYEYFGIGGAALASADTRRNAYDTIFSIVCPASNGYLPTHKIHGFGMTSFDLMLRYPWYSVDSTTWVLTGRFGSILVPKIKDGVYHYNKPPDKVCVSLDNPSKRDAGKHFSTYSKMEQEQYLEYIHSKGFKMGKSKRNKEGQEEVVEEGIANNYKMRDEMNILFFIDFERGMPEWPQPYIYGEVKQEEEKRGGARFF